MTTSVTRREFLELGSSATLGLVLGFYLPRHTKPTPVPAAEVAINAWLRIGTDDTITIIVSESEMGQGVLTSLPMILADELEADWTKVRSEHALADRAKYGRQSTGGSTSVRTDYDGLRKVGAAAREMLISAAATTWNVNRSTCRAENGTVIHGPTGRRLTYGQLAAKAATLPVPETPPLKPASAFRLIGKDTKRLDTRAKVTATATFGIDVTVPGMLIAQVAHPPIFGGKVGRFDATRAKAVPGVRDVIEIPTGIAVVADHFWAATKGRDALVVEWDDAGHGQLSSLRIADMLQQAVTGGADARSDGDAEGAITRAAKRVEATYDLPYLAHAPMEPLNCTADVKADRCEVWAPSQSPSGTQDLAREITGLPADKVIVHTTFLGGGFGRRSQTDFVADAVHTSKALGRPVKVIWSREDDVRGGWYRPVAHNRLAGGLDANGWPVAWVHRIASPSIMAGFGRPLRDGIDGAGVEGAANLPYGIPNIHVTYAAVDLPITLWWWRSVGSSINGYVTECFLDELAHAGGKDPVELRRRLLADHPRHRRVLDIAAQKSGWGTPLPNGHARGVAVHESFGSIVAEVADVSLQEDGTPRVHHVTCAVDCGQVVNPDIVRAQMESGIVYGLSAALWGAITIENGRAVQGNFDNYRVLRMREMPSIDVTVVAEGDPFGGVGEPGTPPIAPAVCNAMLALTGKPARRLPIMGG